MITALFGQFMLTSVGKKLPAWVWEILIIAALIGGGMLLHHAAVVHHDNGVRTTAKTEQRTADQKVLDQTVANYRAAAEKAKLEDAANVARVQTAQTKINQETDGEYEARIAAARAAADKLRRQLASETNSSGRPGATVPSVPAAAGRPAQAASQDELSTDDQLTATEQAIQLDELIKWVRKQSAVDVNGE